MYDNIDRKTVFFFFPLLVLDDMVVLYWSLHFVSHKLRALYLPLHLWSYGRHNVWCKYFAEKLMYFSEKFDAKLFLSRIHQDTTAADLDQGAHALKTDLKGRTQLRKQLVKDNFDCFVSCKTTIDGMHPFHVTCSGVKF